MPEVLLHDVVLDLVQILEEASDSGRLVGGDETTVNEVSVRHTNDRIIGDEITLTLSNGEKVDLRIRLHS